MALRAKSDQIVRSRQEQLEAMRFMWKVHRQRVRNERHLRKLGKILSVEDWRSVPWKLEMLDCVAKLLDDVLVFSQLTPPVYREEEWKGSTYFYLYWKSLSYQMKGEQLLLSVDVLHVKTGDHPDTQSGFECMRQAVFLVPDIQQAEKQMWRQLCQKGGGYSSIN